MQTLRPQLSRTRALLCFLFASIVFVSAPPPQAQAASPKAAIFVKSRVEKLPADTPKVLEDLITSQLDDTFSIISPETVLSAATDGADLDKETDRSSMANLAASMGADYLIYATISSFGQQRKQSKAYGVETVNIISTLRATCKIIGADGGTIASVPITVTEPMRAGSPDDAHFDDGLVSSLLEKAAILIGEKAKAKLERKGGVPDPQESTLVDFSVICGLQDMTGGVPMTLPHVGLAEDGTVKISEARHPVRVLDVSVELDGLVVGSAPGTFKARPGLHKLRLTREGYRPVEKNINVTPGMSLKIAMQMTDKAYARWKDNTAFLQQLENNKRLTAAEAERIEGLAQMYRQSGFKIDAKADVKYDKKVRSILY